MAIQCSLTTGNHSGGLKIGIIKTRSGKMSQMLAIVETPYNIIRSSKKCLVILKIIVGSSIDNAF